MTTDNLKEIFELQEYFQKKLNNNVESQEYIKIMILASIDELMEMLHETPWKPWKKNQTFNKENFKNEYIDLFHFVINLGLSCGFDSDSLTELFKRKHKLNNQRQKENY